MRRDARPIGGKRSLIASGDLVKGRLRYLVNLTGESGTQVDVQTAGPYLCHNANSAARAKVSNDLISTPNKMNPWPLKSLEQRRSCRQLPLGAEDEPVAKMTKLQEYSV